MRRLGRVFAGILALSVSATLVRPVVASPTCPFQARLVGDRAIVDVAAGGGDGEEAPLAQLFGCLSTAFEAAGERTVWEIRLAAGIHRLARPIAVRPPVRRSGTVLRIVGVAGATRISGARLLGEGRPVDGALLGLLPASVRSKARAVPVPEALAPLLSAPGPRDHRDRSVPAAGEPVVGGRVLRRAAWPGEGFAAIERPDADGLGFVADRALPVFDGEASLFGYLGNDWADTWRPSADVDVATRHVRFSGAAKYGLVAGGRFRLEGNLAYLARPGDWAFDAARSTLVFLPRSADATVEVTAVEKLFDLDGWNDLRVDGVTFENVRDTLVSVSGRNVVFENCVFRNAGGPGVVLSGSGGGLRRSRIEATGWVGLRLVGGDRRTLRPGGLFVEESEVTDFGRVRASYAPGVLVEGVGNVVRAVRVHGGPHAGIMFFGNDHRIIDDEVFDVARQTGDVGAIYTGRDWVGRGHLVAGNYVHDVAGVGRHEATAIYLDDHASGVTVRDNLIWRVPRGLQIGGGRDNTVTGNLVFHADECLKLEDRIEGRSAERVEEVTTMLLRGLAAQPIDRPPWSGRYPGLDTMRIDRPARPIGNVVTGNRGDCRWIVAGEAARGGRIEDNGPIDRARYADPGALAGERAPPRSAFARRGVP